MLKNINMESKSITSFKSKLKINFDSILTKR